MDNALQPGRRVARDLRNARRIFTQDGRHRLGGRRMLKSALAGQHLIQDGAKREDISPMIDQLASHHFRRHIAGRAHHRARLGFVSLSRRAVVLVYLPLLRLHQFRQAEVQNLDPAFFGDEQVLRLQVAMNDAFVVGSRQPMSNLNAQVDRPAKRHVAMPQLLSQSLSHQ
jgi:hypothetical protein